MTAIAPTAREQAASSPSTSSPTPSPSPGARRVTGGSTSAQVETALAISAPTSPVSPTYTPIVVVSEDEVLPQSHLTTAATTCIINKSLPVEPQTPSPPPLLFASAPPPSPPRRMPSSLTPDFAPCAPQLSPLHAPLPTPPPCALLRGLRETPPKPSHQEDEQCELAIGTAHALQALPLENVGVHMEALRRNVYSPSISRAHVAVAERALADAIDDFVQAENERRRRGPRTFRPSPEHANSSSASHALNNNHSIVSTMSPVRGAIVLVEDERRSSEITAMFRRACPGLTVCDYAQKLKRLNVSRNQQWHNRHLEESFSLYNVHVVCAELALIYLRRGELTMRRIALLVFDDASVACDRASIYASIMREHYRGLKKSARPRILAIATDSIDPIYIPAISSNLHVEFAPEHTIERRSTWKNFKTCGEQVPGALLCDVEYVYYRENEALEGGHKPWHSSKRAGPSEPVQRDATSRRKETAFLNDLDFLMQELGPSAVALYQRRIRMRRALLHLGVNYRDAEEEEEEGRLRGASFANPDILLGLTGKALSLLHELQCAYEASTNLDCLMAIVHAGRAVVATALREVISILPGFKGLTVRVLLGDEHAAKSLEKNANAEEENGWQGAETDDDAISSFAAGEAQVLIVASNNMESIVKSRRPLPPSPFVIRFDGSLVDGEQDGGGGRCRVIVFKPDARTNLPKRREKEVVLEATKGDKEKQGPLEKPPSPQALDAGGHQNGIKIEVANRRNNRSSSARENLEMLNHDDSGDDSDVRMEQLGDNLNKGGHKTDSGKTISEDNSEKAQQQQQTTTRNDAAVHDQVQSKQAMKAFIAKRRPPISDMNSGTDSDSDSDSESTGDKPLIELKRSSSEKRSSQKTSKSISPTKKQGLAQTLVKASKQLGKVQKAHGKDPPSAPGTNPSLKAKTSTVIKPGDSPKRTTFATVKDRKKDERAEKEYRKRLPLKSTIKKESRARAAQQARRKYRQSAHIRGEGVEPRHEEGEQHVYRVRPAEALVGPDPSRDGVKKVHYLYKIQIAHQRKIRFKIPTEDYEEEPDPGIQDFGVILSRKLGRRDLSVSIQDLGFDLSSGKSCGKMHLKFLGELTLSANQVKQAHNYTSQLFCIVMSDMNKHRFVWGTHLDKKLNVTSKSSSGDTLDRSHLRNYVVVPLRTILKARPRKANPTTSAFSKKSRFGEEVRAQNSLNDKHPVQEKGYHSRRDRSDVASAMHEACTPSRLESPEKRNLVASDEISWERLSGSLVSNFLRYRSPNRSSLHNSPRRGESLDKHADLLENKLIQLTYGKDVLLAGNLRYDMSPLMKMTRSKRFALNRDGTLKFDKDIKNLVNTVDEDDEEGRFLLEKFNSADEAKSSKGTTVPNSKNFSKVQSLNNSRVGLKRSSLGVEPNLDLKRTGSDAVQKAAGLVKKSNIEAKPIAPEVIDLTFDINFKAGIESDNEDNDTQNAAHRNIAPRALEAERDRRLSLAGKKDGPNTITKEVDKAQQSLENNDDSMAKNTQSQQNENPKKQKDSLLTIERNRKRNRKVHEGGTPQLFSASRNRKKGRTKWVGDISLTYEEYYRDRNVNIKILDQPLIAAMKPPSVSLEAFLETVKGRPFKGVLCEIVEQDKEPMFLVPELCRVFPISAGALFLPSALMMLERHVLLCELRDKYADHVGVPIDLSTLLQAVTSVSADSSINYERLELLGDSVLKLSTTLRLFKDHPHFTEGDLHHDRAVIVCNNNLRKIALQQEIDKFCLFEKQFIEKWTPPGVDRQGRVLLVNNKSLADVIEALCGAFFIAGTESYQSQKKASQERPNSKAKASQPDELSDVEENFDMQDIQSEENSNLSPLSVGAICKGYDSAVKFLETCGVFPETEPTHQEMLLSAIHSLHPRTSPPPTEVTPQAFPVDPRLSKPEKPWEDQFGPLESLLGYHFKRRHLLLCALTHGSYIDSMFSSSSLSEAFQRLEFLGDAVVDFCVTRYLFDRYRTLGPGELTELKGKVVSNEAFARVAVQNELHKYLFLSSEALQQEIDRYVEVVRKNKAKGDAVGKDDELAKFAAPKVLGDMFESIIGAIFVDSGLEQCWRISHQLLAETLEKKANPADQELHPVIRFAELVRKELAICNNHPDYKTESIKSPEKEGSGKSPGTLKRAVVFVSGKAIAHGDGNTKRRACSRAADAAYKRLKNAKQGSKDFELIMELRAIAIKKRVAAQRQHTNL